MKNLKKLEFKPLSETSYSLSDLRGSYTSIDGIEVARCPITKLWEMHYNPGAAWWEATCPPIRGYTPFPQVAYGDSREACLNDVERVRNEVLASFLEP